MEAVFTDLDGTLLNNHQEVSVDDSNSLKELAEKGIYRVIATGRSWFSFQKVIPSDFPIDYLVFSSGAGVLNFKTKELIYSQNHSKDDVRVISELLIKENCDFMAHFEVMDNHKFVFHQTLNACDDFHRRLNVYKEFAIPYTAFHQLPEKSAQIIVVAHDNNNGIVERLREMLPNYKIIRATSPLDGNSVWIEIFPKNVSKGFTCSWLCEYLGINTGQTIGIGNDYNDLDLLEFTSESFVVENAPNDLKQKYKVCLPNTESGFTDALIKASIL